MTSTQFGIQTRQMADNSAKMLIENHVRGIIPEIPDLVVEVELYI